VDQTKAKNTETILVITTGLLVLYYIFEAPKLILAATIISVLGLAFPIVAKGISWVWYKLALALGYVNSRILLTLIFIIFLVPVAFLARIFTSDLLRLKKKPGPNESYYADRNHEYSAKDLKNVW